MAMVWCWNNSCRVQKSQIELPSAHPRPPRPSRGRNARFPGHRRVNPIVRSQVRMEDVVDIMHNKVLMATAISGAIGQLAKPFSRVFLSGEEKKKAFDLRAAIESGGFPSSHSSAVTATATSLLLERGFADSIFGLSVIYAAIVMYDAQGVRREVGKHARVLNKKHLGTRTNPGQSMPPVNSSTTGTHIFSDKNSCSSGSELEKNAALVTSLDVSAAVERQARTVSVLTVDEHRVAAAEEDEMVTDLYLLKEGVGHTKLEVVAGALLGISVGFFIHNLM